MENSIKKYDEVYTNIKKGFGGWQAKTLILGINGYDWEIHTSKERSGISSLAQGGKSVDQGNYRTFKFMMFTDPSVSLAKSESRCTEKAIRQLHLVALLKFDELIDEGKLPGKAAPDYEIKPGQMIVLENPQSPTSNLVIYEISELGGEDYYHFVNTKTLALGRTEILEDFEDKNGIGYYYRRGETMDIDQVNDLVLQAKAKKQIDDQNKAAQADRNRIEINRKIAEGRYFCEIRDPKVKKVETDIPEVEAMSFHETKHTKKGHDLFVVKLEEQLERDEFIELKSLAKKHNGYYSSFRGSGAIPGFHFLDKEDALTFLSNHSSDKS